MTAKAQFNSLLTKEFLSKISHHSRSAFNGLLGFSELLLLNKGKLDDEDATEYLLRVNMLAKKAFISSENMILLLKIFSADLMAPKHPVLFSTLLATSYNLNTEAFKLKNIEFISESEPGFTVNCNSTLTTSMLSNIISKAVTLCSDNSRIVLTAKTVKNKQVINLTYKGFEIESEAVHQFFSNQDSTPDTDLFAPELDIELWICYQLAKLQDVYFGITFSKSKGSTFCLEF